MDDLYQTEEINMIFIHRQIFCCFPFLFVCILQSSLQRLNFFHARSFLLFFFFLGLLSISCLRSRTHSNIVCLVSIFCVDFLYVLVDICARLCHFNILAVRNRTWLCVCAFVCMCCTLRVCNQCRCERSKLEANGFVMSPGILHIHNTRMCMHPNEIYSTFLQIEDDFWGRSLVRIVRFAQFSILYLQFRAMIFHA